MSTKVLIVEEFGDSSKLKYEPAEGEGLLKNEICGLNYLEVMIGDGYLPLEALGSGFPLTMGVEAAGIVETVGANVSSVTKGERVAYAVVGSGAYAEYAKVSASTLVKVPDEVSFEQAASSMIQRLTAHYLVHTIGRVKAGDKVLIQAISGGSGPLVCQVAKNAGNKRAFLIGTTSSEAEAGKARDAGADEVILYLQKDFAEEVNKIIGGKGVNVIYDGIGKKTFEKDLECLAIQRIVVSFGLVSGPPTPIDVEKLAKGSFSICRPLLFHYIANKEDLEWRSSEVFNWIKTDKAKLGDFTVLPLSEGKKAYELLGSGKSTGKVLMKP